MHVKLYEFVSYCLRFREISLVICTFFFISTSLQDGRSTLTLLVISCGLIAACFLSTRIYRRCLLAEQANIKFARIVFLTEFVFHCFIIIISGGFFSPYLWYCVGSIPIGLTIHTNLLTALYVLLYASSVILGHVFFSPTKFVLFPLLVNSGVGLGIVFISFYGLHKYIMRLTETEARLREANIELTQRSELGDFVLSQMLVEQNSGVARTPEHVMENLIVVFQKYTGDIHNILIKLDKDQEIEHVAFTGFSDEEVCMFLPHISTWLQTRDKQKMTQYEDYIFYAFDHGDAAVAVLVYRYDKTPAPDRIPYIERFFNLLTKLVLMDIDTQKHIELLMKEHEHRRIAEEIHDTILQQLFAATCILNTLKNSDISTYSEEKLKHSLHEAEQIVTGTMQDIRNVINDVRKNGIPNTLRERISMYIRAISGISDITIEANIDDKAVEKLSTARTAVCYRVLCEAINNAVRHSKAEHITVSATERDGFCVLSITDDGVGFDPSEKEKSEGGLYNITKLIEEIHGICDITSGEKKGTEIEITLPL